jgi:hypothetical protein
MGSPKKIPISTSFIYLVKNAYKPLVIQQILNRLINLVIGSTHGLMSLGMSFRNYFVVSESRIDASR